MPEPWRSSRCEIVLAALYAGLLVYSRRVQITRARLEMACLGALLLAACGGSAAPAAPASGLGLAGATASSASAAAGSAAAKPSGQGVTVRVGGLGGTPDRGFWVGEDKGYYAEQGITLDLAVYKSFSEMLPLLATGKIDVGAGGISPGFFNALLSGVNVKIVSDASLVAEPPPGKHMSYGLMVRSDLKDQVKRVADMKGRTIAVNGTQGIGQVQLDAILQTDGALQVEPFVTLGIQQNVAFPLLDLAKAMPNSPAQWVFYSTEFITNNPDAGKRFLVAYTKAMRLVEDGFFKNKGRDEVVQLYIKHTQAKDPRSYDEQTPTENEVNANVNRQAVEQAQEYFVSHGWQKSKVDVNQVVDASFGDYVRQVLGTYK